MRKGNNLLVLGTLHLLLCCSCAPLYIPPPAQIPQLEKRGDISASLQFGNQGGTINLSYAYTNHLCLLGTYSSLNIRDDVWAGGSIRNHRYWELGTGWFLPSAENFTLLVAGGVGTAHAFARLSKTDRNSPMPSIIRHTGDYTRYFIQVNTAFTSEVGSAGLVTRYAHVNMDYTDLTSTNHPVTKMEDYLEVIVYITLGSPRFRFFCQVGGISYFGSDSEIPYRPLVTSMGLRFKFNLAKGQE